MILDLYPGRFVNLNEIKGNISVEEYIQWMKNSFHMTEFSRLANHTQHCDYHKIIAQVKLITITSNKRILLTTWQYKSLVSYENNMWRWYYSINVSLFCRYINVMMATNCYDIRASKVKQ